MLRMNRSLTSTRTFTERLLDSLRRGRERRSGRETGRRNKSPQNVANAIEAVEQRTLLTNVIDGGEILADNAPAEPTDTGVDDGVEFGRFANEDTFKLHSNPNSNFTLYLDFDGHVTEGTTWNANANLPSIPHPAYDRGNTPGVFSQSELDLIQAAWARVAEDFAAFDINVTTEDPGYEALRKDDSGTDTQWGVREVMTRDTWASCGCGGFAFLNSFEDLVDEPSFTFNNSLNGVSETISHEVGHQLGLGHDGLASPATTYYSGHGTGATSWGAIMGGPFSRNITHWSDGTYFNSNNTQDDLNQITTSNGFGYRVDDYGDDRASAQDLFVTGGTDVSAFGIIERNTDVDYFRFESGAGDVSFDLRTHVDRPNLDLWAGIYDSTGTLLHESNPSNDTNASFSNVALPTAGVYYLKVDGVGSHGVYNAATDSVEDPTTNQPYLANPPTGYSDYGSIGQYGITGAIVPPATDFVSVTPTTGVQREGNTGTTDFTFTIARTGNLSIASDVDWYVAESRADSPGDNVTPSAVASDFQGNVLPAGTVSFAANESQKIITITVNGDTVSEPDETFDVIIENPTGGFALQTSVAEGTIIGDESAVSVANGIQFRWKQQNWNGTGDNWAIDNISLPGTTFSDDFDPGIDNSQWASTSGAVINSTFSNSVGNTMYFNGPRTSERSAVTTTIDARAGDTLSFDIIFSDNTNGGNGTANGDNVTFEYSIDGGYTWELIRTIDQRFYKTWSTFTFDVPAEAELTDVVQTEGTGGTPATYAFEVLRRDNLDKSFDVSWSVSGVGTNPANAADFPGGVFPTGTLTFAEGEEIGVITVTANSDLDMESDETFQLTLDSSTGEIIVLDSRVGTILNDDGPQDYGDAPSAAQSGFAASYPVTVADNGARHTVGGPQLGVAIDSDLDGINSASADADDTTGSDDEDGVGFLDAIGFASGATQTSMVEINLQSADGTSNLLDAWIDFNQDGDWEDAGEQIFTSFDLGTANGVQTLPFTIPQESGGNVVEGTTYARFRVSTAGGLSSVGAAADGEVEDYQVEVGRAVPLLITEVMFDPDSDDFDWEWIEVYNEATTPIDLSGFVLDDADGPALTSGNIAAGTLPGQSYAVLYDSSNTPAEFVEAWRLGIHLIEVTNWPELNDDGDTVGLWASIAEYGSRDFSVAVDEVAYEDATNGWPDATGNGSSFYLSDVTLDNDDGANWLASVDGTDGAYISTLSVGNTGLDVGSPGFGPAPAMPDFDRIEPFGSQIYSSSVTGSILAGQTLEFSTYLEGGQPLAASLLTYTATSVSLEIANAFTSINTTSGTSSANTPTFVVPSTATYILRITSDTDANFDLSLLRNANVEAVDSFDGGEVSLDSSLLGDASGGRWAGIGVSDPAAGTPFLVTQSNNAGKFVDISGTGMLITLMDEESADFTTTISNTYFPAGTVSVSDNGVLAWGTGLHAPFQNQPLASSAFTQAAVPFWDDFFGAEIYWEETVVDGHNALVVQWHQVDHFEVTGPDTGTFQVQIFATGPLVARYAYQDVEFPENPPVTEPNGRDGGAAATIGLQLTESRATQLGYNAGTAVIANGDVLEFGAVTTDIDEYEIDLTGHMGETIDVLVTGLNGNLEGQTLQLLDTDGVDVLETGTATPVGGLDATNVDLAITDFMVPFDGIYTVRLTSNLSNVQYSVVVAYDTTFDIEPNQISGSERNLTINQDAVGYLEAGSDVVDAYEVNLPGGTFVTIETSFPRDPALSPLITLDPAIDLYFGAGRTLVATDLDSASDGVNASMGYPALQAGTYYVVVHAESGLGEYNLSFSQTPFSVLNSVVVNEVLADPNSATRNFDTDGDGTAADSDEFLELYNTSAVPLDVGGIELWDSTQDQYFTIPASTILAPGGFLVLVDDVAVGGSLPAVDVGSHAFSTGGTMSLGDGGDNIVLYDPSNDEYIQAVYNGDAVDNPTATYAGFSTTATRIGSVLDLGNDTDGTSRALSADGNTSNILDHDTLPVAGVLASPGTTNVGRLPTPVLSIEDVTEIEGVGLVFTVTLDIATAGPFDVDVNFTDDTAIGGTDFNNTVVTLRFNGTAGETQQFTVATTNDAIVEHTEDFFVALTATDPLVDDSATASGSIRDNDTAAVTIADVTASEGGDLIFVVTLDNAVQDGFDVDVSFVDGSAIGGSDYDSSPVTLNFAGNAGETQQVTVPTINDAMLEPTEEFTVNLSASSFLVSDIDAAVGTITDDDSSSVTVEDVTVTEGGAMIFTVSLDNAVAGAFDVNVSFSDVSATGGTDYDNSGVRLNFAGTAGETQQFTVTTTDDVLRDGVETFIVNLSATSALVTADDTAIGTINDNDSATVTIEDVAVIEGGAMLFTVSLDNAVQGAFDVNVSFTDDTATGGADYSNAVAPLSFAGTAGETHQFTLMTTDDNVLEGTETFTVNLDATHALVMDLDTADGTIRDNDSASISIEDVTVSEGGTMLFTVSLDNPVQGAFDVNVSYTNGSATAGADFDDAAVTLNFAGNAGEMQQFSVNTINDAIVETVEDFTVNIDATNIFIGDSDTASGTIIDNDSAAVTIEDVTAIEGGGLLFTATLNIAVTSAFDVDVSFTDGSATGGTDFDNTPVTLNFNGNAGETQQFTVTTTDDPTLEGTEDFAVSLASGTALVTATDTATGTITDNDGAAVTVEDVSVTEGGDLIFTVSLDNAVQGAFDVNVSFTDGSAIGGSDYDATPVTLNFTGNAGETQQFTVTTTGNSVVEGSKSFAVHLAATNALVGSADTATGTITDDDTAAITVENVSATEGGNLEFVVSLDNAVASGFTVNYSSTDGTADSSDYNNASGSVNFTGTAGETQQIIVATTGDMLVETDEDFTLNLSATNLSVDATDTAVGTITNDDSAVITVTGESKAEGTGAGSTTFTFTVNLSAPVDAPVSLTASTQDGSATATDDFTAVSNLPISFAAGSTTAQTVQVSVNADQVNEMDEAFDLVMADLAANGLDVEFSGGTSTLSATANILNDDGGVLIDNTDPEFTTVGSWGTVNRNGYDGGFRYASAGNGSRTAQWSFTGLDPGVYQVQAAYRAWTNRATNAPFTITSGATPLAVLSVDQTVTPDDSLVDGTWFETLATVTVTGTEITVTLTNDANGLVVADAVRAIRQGDVPSGAEIHVTLNGAEIQDNTGVIDFGQVGEGQTAERTITVFNVGTTDLDLTNSLSVPAGFTVSGYSAQTLAAGASTTFTIALDTSTLGPVTGEISFGNTDSDENPFNFTVQADVVRITTIDNSDAGGFATTGNWYTVNRNGHNGGFQFATPGSGSATAAWTFAVDPGDYRVYVSYRSWANRATNAPFTVRDGATPLSTVNVDQTQAANDKRVDGTWFEELGTFSITGNQLIVELNNLANGLVIADAIHIEKVTP